jgi:hypothetical protein
MAGFQQSDSGICVSNFIQLLARLAKLEGELQELRSRTHSIQIATVTDVRESDRTIRVTREAQGGQSQSPFFPAGRSSRHTDEPLPIPGTTVVVALVEGNPHDLVLLRTLGNDTNPPDSNQKAPQNDNTTEIPGNDRTAIFGNQFHGIAGDEERETDGKTNIKTNGDVYRVETPYGRVEVEARNTVTLRNTAGASITLEQNGAVTIRDAFNHVWTLGGSSGGEWQWDLAGATIAVTNAGGFTINGQSVLTIGSVDTRGDANVTRGY